MKRIVVTLALATVIGLTGCEKEAPAPAKPAAKAGQAEARMLTEATRKRLQDLKALGTTWLSALADCAAQLQDDTRILLEHPDGAALDAARARLQHCLDLDQAARLLLGMSPGQEKTLANLRHNLDSPLAMPGYVDSIQGYPYSGIVNDASLALTADNLRQQQGLIDVEDVAIGLDVIAFLLWGEHHFSPAQPPRTVDTLTEVKHWEDGRTDLPVSEHPQNRRRRYLALATDMLAQDSAKLKTAWDKGAPPPTEEEARQWQLRQLQQAQTLLDRFPDNPELARDLDQWLALLSPPVTPAAQEPATTGNAATAAAPATPDTAALRSRLQAAITTLLTAKD